MMEWFTVLLLIIFGVVLLILEIILIPGTTVVGFIGFFFLIFGIKLSFRYFGGEVGWAVLGSTTLLCGGLFYLLLTTDVWKRFSLKTSIKSRVNENKLDHLYVGMEGIAVSTLRPIGKAELNQKIIEVKTNGEYLESGSKIKISSIVSNEVIVELVK